MGESTWRRAASVLFPIDARSGAWQLKSAGRRQISVAQRQLSVHRRAPFYSTDARCQLSGWSVAFRRVAGAQCQSTASRRQMTTARHQLFDWSSATAELPLHGAK